MNSHYHTFMQLRKRMPVARGTSRQLSHFRRWRQSLFLRASRPQFIAPLTPFAAPAESIRMHPKATVPAGPSMPSRSIGLNSAHDRTSYSAVGVLCCVPGRVPGPIGRSGWVCQPARRVAWGHAHGNQPCQPAIACLLIRHSSGN